MNKKAKQAIGVSEIIILIFGIIAISWALGSEVGSVFAKENCNSNCIASGYKGGKIEEGVCNCYNEDGGSVSLAEVFAAGSAATAMFPTKRPKTQKPSEIGEVEAPGGGSEDTGDGDSSWLREPGTAAMDYFELGGRGWKSAGGIIDGAYYAAIAYMGVKMVADFFGDESLSDALSTGAAAGVFTYNGIDSLLGKGGYFEKWGAENAQWIKGNQGLISVGVFLVVTALTYKDTKTETVRFDCNVWQPPEGGDNCEECNQQGLLPCSEYQCRALGQGCELVNKGTEEEKCVWVNRDDVEYPRIEPWEDVLSDDYVYSPDNTISPPDRGVKIIPQGDRNGCVEAFTPLSFGIITDEPAQCKIDYTRKENYDDMEFYFGGKTTLVYNHTQTMSLPGKSNLEAENLTLRNNGDYELYVRCKDANGNRNNANFVFKYCVEEGPDTTPPMIVTTDLRNNMPITFNKTKTDVTLYTNEPADCKWDYLDKDYKEMQKTMQCSRSVTEMNAQMLYECETTLDGIKNRQENNFYFRCKDQPRGVAEEDRNTNQESYKFTLTGTQPLVITDVGPNGTVKDASDPVEVELTAETSAGYKQGESVCYFSDSGEERDYVEFGNTNSHEHSQRLRLSEGDYEYWIKCVDSGGNMDIEKTEFSVDSDNDAPTIVRVFKEEDYLKLITNEDAQCVYDTKNCNYNIEDGININNYDEREHYVDWNIDIIYYIKCKDIYDNQPNPDECNIIARPLKIEEKQAE